MVGVSSSKHVAVNGRIAHEAGVPGGLGERVISDPLLPSADDRVT